MFDLSVYKIGVCFALFSIGIFIVTGFFNLRAYNYSKDTEKQLTYSVQVLNQHIDRLESRIEEFGNLIKEQRSQPQVSELKSDTPESSVNVNETKKETIRPPDDDLKKMKEIIESTGLDKLAANDSIDPNVIKEMYDRRANEKKIQSILSDFRAISIEQLQTDNDQYDEMLNDLYQRTLPRRIGNRISDEERMKAINELLSNYPESYAAAKVATIQVVESVRKKDLEKAEEYYNMLIDIQGQKNDTVVLGNGFEAVPSAGYSLVWAYQRAGRTEDVKQVVNFLEDNYYESLYGVRSRRGLRIVTGEEAIARMRRITGIGQ
ncbi:tol-pal system YbgF family protein [Thermodesulfobacteriota bacterium]